MTSRRQFLKAVLAASVTPSLCWADAGGPRYLAAAKDASGSFALYGLDGAAQTVFRVPLPTRGHAAAAHPSRPEAVAFARRPGTFAIVINCVTGAIEHRLEAPEGRHFMGHGAFMEAGDFLVTTENNYVDGVGVLGLWQRSLGYKRVGEVATHGIGPHDVHLLRDGRLVIANGGILTHPEHGEGRDKLNLDTMEPSLTYLNADMSLSEQHMLAAGLHQNSIRHLAIGPRDEVAFAMQWQGDAFEDVPLLGVHTQGNAPVLFEPSLREHLTMKGYASSVSWDGAGEEVAITSSRGGRVQRFGADGTFVSAHAQPDVSGLAPFETGYLASDGHGRLFGLSTQMIRDTKAKGATSAGVQMLRRLEGLAWDNHIVALF
jgi:hypothetical protein